MFKPVNNKVDPKSEEEILEYWEKNRIFEKQVSQRKGGPRWVFYEGPPTANGEPHLGHVLPRFFKDLFPRYRAMKGYYVERKGGWDTHGLPVELEVEKELGLKSKADIENFGIENFINKCKENVFRYKREWENMIRRFGFWIDLEHPYVTLENDYIESVWWILKIAWEEGLLYQGKKVVPYCARCGCALSSHEVSMGYKYIEEESVFVTMPARDGSNREFLVWTTTPWTLPSNVALAVNRDLEYADVFHKPSGRIYILASELVNRVFEDNIENIEVRRSYGGEELLGIEYEPLFRLYKGEKRAYYVIHGDFVSTTEGTGIVHIAPAFGDEDFQAGKENDLPILQPVDLNGRFTAEFKGYEGMWVKDADKKIMEALKKAGRLWKVQMYGHDYPFCWRCDTPLLYYAKDAWFLKTTAIKDIIIKNNNNINWHPPFMGSGRFGDFLENMIDWALSRERYWGTPLNIWVCQKCGQKVSIGSRRELVDLARDPELAKKVEFHKPYIDKVVLMCLRCGGDMHRVPEVIDCWFDSGAMHTAQWHYPFENRDVFFTEKYPADFICEGQDQTRGWFYSLLVLSSLVYRSPCFLNVLGTGLGLDKNGVKMSKSLKNMIDPWELIRLFGADVVRWYYAWNTAPWNSMILSIDLFRETLNKFMGTLRNTVSFFVIYANIAGYDPRKVDKNSVKYRLIDRWILSKINRLARDVTRLMDNFDSFHAARDIDAFVDDLSNWYIRSTRQRFWEFEMTESKVAAFETLYEVLVTLSKILAPFIPFWAEETYLSLVKSVYPDAKESVHLCDFPQPAENMIDDVIEDHMDKVRKVVYLGLQARNKKKIKVRQPLRRLNIVKHYALSFIESEPEYVDLIKNELNVKEVGWLDSYEPDYRIKMNYKVVGPKLGGKTKELEKFLEDTDTKVLAESLRKDRNVRINLPSGPVQLTDDMVVLERVDEENVVSTSGYGITVVLDTKLDDELINEGFAREVVNKIQFMRKEAKLDIMDRIVIEMETTEKVKHAVNKHLDRVKHETLCTDLLFQLSDGHNIKKDWKINGEPATIGIKKV